MSMRSGVAGVRGEKAEPLPRGDITWRLQGMGDPSDELVSCGAELLDCAEGLTMSALPPL